MSSRSEPRNRLAKPLPQEWRDFLLKQGLPKRKYVAVCRATLADGQVIDPLIIEQGWIVSVHRDRLGGQFEERIEFDPRTIQALEVLQVA
jgi:hypothetical protein